MSTLDKLECVIRDQLSNEISRSRFDIGYIQGSHIVTIRSREDLLEVWSNIKKGSNVILGCDGLKTKPTCESGKKGAAISDSSEDDHEDDIEETVKKKRKRAKNADEEEVGETRKKRKKGEDKDKKVQETIDKLIEKHGDKAYTPMQYRVWAEMCIGGVTIYTQALILLQLQVFSIEQVVAQ